MSKSDMPQILNPEIIDAISANPDVFKLLQDSDKIDVDSDAITIMCDNCRISCSPKLLKFLLCNVKIENGGKAYTTGGFEAERGNFMEIQSLLKHLKDNFQELIHLQNELTKIEMQIDKKRKIMSQREENATILETKIREKSSTLEIISNMYDTRLSNSYRREIANLKQALAHEEKRIEELNFLLKKEHETKDNLKISINEITEKLNSILSKNHYS